jgi:hypothetical protein
MSGQDPVTVCSLMVNLHVEMVVVVAVVVDLVVDYLFDYDEPKIIAGLLVTNLAFVTLPLSSMSGQGLLTVRSLLVNHAETLFAVSWMHATRPRVRSVVKPSYASSSTSTQSHQIFWKEALFP